ncbi:hypothetical protein LCGC14_2179010 [marine sediment metagenome]|uniref:Uncharacterized protein n=1 Tax=marine sediment metagenome TaxID=412755 RepID=A0A0F9GIP9_9ZZZZ
MEMEKIMKLVLNLKLRGRDCRVCKHGVGTARCLLFYERNPDSAITCPDYKSIKSVSFLKKLL